MSCAGRAQSREGDTKPGKQGLGTCCLREAPLPHTTRTDTHMCPPGVAPLGLWGSQRAKRSPRHDPLPTLARGCGNRHGGWFLQRWAWTTVRHPGVLTPLSSPAHNSSGAMQLVRQGHELAALDRRLRRIRLQVSSMTKTGGQAMVRVGVSHMGDAH